MGTSTPSAGHVLQRRAAGVVAHFTSLPGPHGCGDLGPAAWQFVRWLNRAGCSLWQVLPVNPVGPGDSPYQSPSAFAGSPLLVALEPLVQAGWLAAPADPPPPSARVDYGRTTPWRWAQLQAAARGFLDRATAEEQQAFDDWCHTHSAWLPDWALFAALKDAHGGQPWWAWAPALARRDPAVLAGARQTHANAVRTHTFVQWCFDAQMAALKTHAAAHGVQLMGDLPIFVAHDSADVWARPDLYWLDDQQQPAVVAGCPPDGYSPLGQRWGNPLYRWDRMAADGYAWWMARARRALDHAHLFRIDHFRGFAGYWEIPATCSTAVGGRWAPGPGAPLFKAIEQALGGLPIVAEDLGTITPDVIALRDQLGLPGMCIVHEGLMHGAAHPFMPHHHVPHGVAYTSTHDSDTVCGWWDSAAPEQRAYAAGYLGLPPDSAGPDVAHAVLRATLASVSNTALAPLQDLLGLGREHRMNQPGTADGNWGWRFNWGQVGEDVAPRLRQLLAATGRLHAVP